MKRDDLSPSTRAIHTNEEGPRTNRPVAPPIYLSATFESTDIDEQVAGTDVAVPVLGALGRPSLVRDDVAVEREGQRSGLGSDDLRRIPVRHHREGRGAAE